MKIILLGLIRGYRLVLSPLWPPTCRFVPTCSQYALDAITSHGVLKGSGLSVARICRCHPWHPGGYDPVPPPQAAAPMTAPIDQPERIDGP
jgi:uncharacterized protein